MEECSKQFMNLSIFISKLLSQCILHGKSNDVLLDPEAGSLRKTPLSRTTPPYDLRLSNEVFCSR